MPQRLLLIIVGLYLDSSRYSNYSWDVSYLELEGGFLKRGNPKKFMVYHGRSHFKMWMMTGRSPGFQEATIEMVSEFTVDGHLLVTTGN